MNHLSSKCALPALALMLLVGCTPTVANRGNLIETEKLEQLKVGESTREQVVTTLGSPTQIGAFDENVWYYFGSSTKQYAFLDPETVQQSAVEIHFNDEGLVTSIDNIDATKTAQVVDPVSRRTPTYGHETTILEQLVGNLGRPGGLAGRESRK